MSLYLKIWSWLSDWWEKKESDKKRYPFTTRIWLRERNERQLPTMDLLKETKSFSKNMSLTKLEGNKWQIVKRIKLWKCNRWSRIWQRHKWKMRWTGKISTNRLYFTNKQWERKVWLITVKWQRKRRIWINLTSMHSRTKKLIFTQWFQESITSVQLELSLWTECEIL